VFLKCNKRILHSAGIFETIVRELDASASVSDADTELGTDAVHSRDDYVGLIGGIGNSDSEDRGDDFS
jgi:hypothetical protein